MFRYTPFLVAAASAASGGAGVPPDVAQVVLKKLIDQIPSQQLVLCIQVNSRDPSTALLRSLQRPDRTVVLGSECRWWDDTHKTNYHFKTGRPAHFLTVSDPVWASKSAVSVQASEAYHGLWVMYWTVSLSHNGSGWNIVSFHLDAEA